MEERLQQLRQNTSQVFERLSSGQRLALISLLALVVTALISLVYITSQIEYSTLYSGVDERFGGQVTTELQSRNIPYEVSPGGVIRVPANMVAELRMSLVSQGVIPGGGIGYELIDKDDMFGVPDEIIQLQKHRMLEGELSRSISTMSGVSQARVHLAVPKNALFVEDKKPVSASVVIQLAGGAQLNKNQIQSIVELVSGAVPGLESERVNVVDNQGRVLNRYAEDLIGGQTTFEYQQSLEKRLTSKVRSIIERIVGQGNVEVVVTSEMDFSREERTEEIFDPEKQVARSEETLNEERESGANQVGGPAGANVAQGVVRVGNAGSSTRERVATNYEINKVTKYVVGPSAQLQNISVAVVVNSSYKQVLGQGEEGESEITPEDLKKLQVLVQSAVGYSRERGDSIQVLDRPFQKASVDVIQALEQQETRQFIAQGVKWLIIALIAILVFVIAYRLMKYLTTGTDAAEILQDGQLPPGEDQIALPGAELLDELDEDEGPLLEKIREFVKRNPDKASAVIRYWLSPIDEE
jgi:flagellar M-ring protein FliF